MREFSAAEDEESFHVFYPGEDEPVVISKWGLRDQPDVVAQIRSRVVPNDAPGHQSGVFLANAMPEGTPAQEMSVLAQAAQDELAAQYPPTVTTIDPALVSSQPAPIVAGEQSVMEPMSVTPDGFGGQSIQPIESVDPSLDVSMPPPKQVYQSLLNTEAAPQSLGGVPQTGAGPFQTQYAGPALSAAGQQADAAGVPPAAGSAGVGAGGRVGMGVKQSSERGGSWRESDGIGAPPVDQAQLERDARAAVLANLAGEADKAAKDRDIAVQEQFLKDKAMLEQQNAADIARRDIEAKEMKRQIMEGKIDPTRLFSSMDGGRQAVTLISMVLGGLANGASGFRTGNVAVDMFDRMIDRDIAAQKDGLDRKQSMYRDFIQEGRDAQQAFLLTKAAMQEGLAAQLRLNASKLGSETAMMNAEQNAIAIESAAKANRDKATNDWTKIELDKRMTAAQIAKMRSDAQRQKEMTAIDYMNAETARARVGGGAAGGAPGKNPPMEIAPGVIVQPADATSRQNLEKAVDAFTTMRNLIVDARAHRAKAGAQLIPRTADYVKADRLEKQLITALNNVENLGAFDKGTADLLGQIVPKIGGVYTPKVVDESLADLLSLATKKFQSKIMTNVVPGTGLVNFTGAQGDFKPVGKAD